MNDDPEFVEAMAEVVKEHLEGGERVSRQSLLRCPMCTNARCGAMKVCAVRMGCGEVGKGGLLTNFGRQEFFATGKHPEKQVEAK